MKPSGTHAYSLGTCALPRLVVQLQIRPRNSYTASEGKTGLHGKDRLQLDWSAVSEFVSVDADAEELYTRTPNDYTDAGAPPQWGAADAEIKVPSGENTELETFSL